MEWRGASALFQYPGCRTRRQKKMGIRYLLIDCLAINQELGGDELIGHVVSFSTLYEKLPVIAAYDMKGEEHVDTTCRPWITSEIRAWVKNPNRIIYASHMNSVPYLRLRVKPAIRWVWHTTFSETALGILFGQVGMTCLSDFKYLMPPYAQLLSMAFARMCRDDYLLTIALLSEAHRSTNSIATRVMMDIWECTFDQYNVREYTGGLETRRGEEAFDVYLGDTKVAYWICGFSLHTSREWTKLYTLPDTERSICKAIGLADAEWEEFAAKEEDRRDFLLLHLDHDIESFVDDVDSVEDYSDSVMDKMDSAVDEYTHRDTTDNQESWRVRCNVVTIKRRRSVTFRSSKQGQDSS
ncbi:hypothetical protein QBC43DRAFT_316308 [Cladorrhinum sp. PSN259]|nr:hypothetical protein QBC43DRAFT_316308 [Cladorrhinum sp. PSN259]